MLRPLPLTLAVFAFALVASSLRAEPASPAQAAVLHYNRDIRPLLSDNCFYCHGPDKNHRKGKFRLDDRDSAIEKGAITPGKPAESKLIDRIISQDDEEVMPPPETHKVLTAAQKSLLKQWIAQGAAYEPFWAYIPPVRPGTPSVNAAAWVRNPIDAFILQQLETHSLAPSAQADRRTLLRRLSLDLIGLPPTLEEMQAFLDDKSPDAYEKQVERLLASPHYGERMAVPWLDAVRFADTVGFHGDQNANVFPYRDYVINSFNANKPFDQFTIEQIGGDLLEHPTTEQLIATGFNRLNMMTREGGAQSKEYLAKYAADRVRTLSGAFLGSTMGCCECHDHKYDPFTAKDFYSMEAFWADVKQWGVYSSYGYTPNPELKGWTNESPFPPEIVVDSPYLKNREQRMIAAREQVIGAAAAKLMQDPKRQVAFAQWKQETLDYLKVNPGGWTVVQPTKVTTIVAPKPGEKAKPAVVPPVAQPTAPKVAPAGKTPVAVDPLNEPGAGTAVPAKGAPVVEKPSGPLSPVLRGEGGSEGSGEGVRKGAPPISPPSSAVSSPNNPSPPPSPLSTGERGQKAASAKGQALGGSSPAPVAPASGKPSNLSPKSSVLSPPATSPTTKPKPQEVFLNPDGTVLFTGRAFDTDKIEFALHAGTIASVRLEALPHQRHGGTLLRAQMKTTAETITLPSAEVRVNIAIKPKSGAELRPGISDGDADFKDARFNNGYEVIGTRDAWRTASAHAKKAQSEVLVFDRPVKVAEGDLLIVTLDKNALGNVRVSVSPLAPDAPADKSFVTSLQKTLQADDSQTPAASLPAVQKVYLLSTAWDVPSLTEYRRLREEVRLCRNGKSPTLVTVATTQPMVTRILPRGNWQDETAPVVQPATPHFLPAPPDTGGRRLTRLDLAKWIVSANNPLTSRTIANRLWKQFFGNGIVMSTEDLGAQGDFPSHPELLDWLAVEFRGSGWDVKHMVRLMVESAAYRQGSNLRPALRDLDPNNRLLASQNPRRLEAEFVRDNALAIAGLLNPDIGGPSAFPYQPAGYYVNLQFPNRDYINDTDEREYRRGLYMHWQRTFLHPMLANFDAPSREDSVCTRNVSNTPQQALTLLNDPEFVESARVLASKAASVSMDDERRLEFVFQKALCRSPRAREAQSLREFLAGQREIYKAAPKDAAKLVHEGIAPVPGNADAVELAAWTNVCRVVLNLHETMTRY